LTGTVYHNAAEAPTDALLSDHAVSPPIAGCFRAALQSAEPVVIAPQQGYPLGMFNKTCLLALCAFLSAGVWGQVSTSRLTGTVVDSSGAAVPNAKVTVRNDETGVARSATLSDSGVYTFDALPTGMYTVEVEATGFKTASLRGNEVRIGQPTTINVTLDI